MNGVHRVCLFSAMSVSIAVVSVAQTPSLNIKLGSWEVSTAMNMAGLPPGLDPSTMTPEQQARLEAAAKARANQAPRVRTTCVTKENLQKGTFLDSDSSGMKCTQALTTNTATALDATLSCTGNNTSRTAHIHIDAPSSTSFKATVNNTTTNNGRTMTINGTIAGKWLAADCKKAVD